MCLESFIKEYEWWINNILKIIDNNSNLAFITRVMMWGGMICFM